MNGTPDDMALAVEGVRKDYVSPAGRHSVLRDVSFGLGPGESVAVVGPSGAGKSTLLNIIGSLDRPTAGSVRLGRIEVGELEGAALAEFRSRRVGFVFQDHHLLPQCSALENVLLPTLAASDPGAPARARELLERVGLGERLDSFPAELSGGERQRVAVARSLVNGPAAVALRRADGQPGPRDRRRRRLPLPRTLPRARRHARGRDA